MSGDAIGLDRAGKRPVRAVSLALGAVTGVAIAGLGAFVLMLWTVLRVLVWAFAG